VNTNRIIHLALAIESGAARAEELSELADTLLRVFGRDPQAGETLVAMRVSPENAAVLGPAFASLGDAFTAIAAPLVVPGEPPDPLTAGP